MTLLFAKTHGLCGCRVLGLLAIGLLTAGPGIVIAQPAEQPTATASRPSAPTAPQRLPDRSTPAVTVDRFLELYRQSKDDPTRNAELVAYLDFSQLPADDRASEAALAGRLAEYLIKAKVIDQQKYEQLRLVADDKDRVVVQERTLTEDGEPARVVLEKADDGLWRFAAETVAVIKPLYATTVAPASSQPADAPTNVLAEYISPQATMRTFLEAFVGATDLAQAASCLNLTAYRLASTDQQAQDFARKLKSVLDRRIVVEMSALPDNPATESPFIFYSSPEGNIALSREEDGRWLFAGSTVQRIEALTLAAATQPTVVAGAEHLTFDIWLASRLPEALKTRYLDVALWKWLGIFVVVLLGVAADRLLRPALHGLVWLVLRWAKGEIPEDVQSHAFRPIGYTAMGWVWLEGFQRLAINNAFLVSWLTGLSRFILVVASVWATYRVVDLIASYLQSRAGRTTSKFDDILIPLLRKTVKIAVTVAGIAIFAKRIFPEDYEKVLAGLGLGGLAFALAAQDTIKNFFGSVTVLLDRPFEIGDWVIIGEVEGTVEAIGFRSTRIRTFYHSVVSVPNGHLIDAITNNMGRRKYRRISCKVGVTYDTPPEKIDAFCEGIRELIRRHPYTRKDAYHVYLNEYADFSLNILLYCFHEVPDWSTELRERHRLFLDILKLAEHLGVEFAFPTQTIHLERGDGGAASGEGTRGKAGASRGADGLSPDVLGRSEAAIIMRGVSDRELGATETPRGPQPVDDAYVRRRVSGKGDADAVVFE